MLLITPGSCEVGKGEIVSLPTTLGNGIVGRGGWSYSICFFDSIFGSLANKESSPDGLANYLCSNLAMELDFFIPLSGIDEINVSSAKTRALLLESPLFSRGATS